MNPDRELNAYLAGGEHDRHTFTDRQVEADFDRWLDQHDEEIAADAWVEGLLVGLAGGHKDALALFEAEIRAKVAAEIRAGGEHTRTTEPTALDRLDRLRELHQPSEFIMLVDANNPDVKAPACRTCLQKSWPCDTRRIIDEEGDNQ